MGTALLTTRLHIPQVAHHLVSRTALIEKINQQLHHKIILVSAPAGYGKSTLLGQWAAQTTWPVAWLSLDKNDSDPTLFLTSFVAALQTLHPDLGQRVLSMLAAPQAPDIESLMIGLLNELNALSADFVLVLDDYHLTGAPPIHKAMARLLDHLPPAMHLVLLTRTVPPLPLARLRARGRLWELHAADLNFGTKAATAFLNESMALDLAPEEVAALVARTEGWIAGLQLAALALRRSADRQRFIASFSGEHRYIWDYLAEEVFQRQDEQVQRFLLQTAVLTRLNADLCDAVTERKDGRVRLMQLEQANLFLIPLDDERRWYRYHPLFSEFLRRRLEHTHPEQLSVCHRRAAAWYRQADHVEEALHHLRAVDDQEEMADLLEQHMPHMWQSAQMATVRRWLHILPEALISTRPYLALSFVSALIDTYKLDLAEKYLRQAAGAFGIDYEHNGTDKPSHVPRHLFNEVIVLRCTIAYFRRDVPSALALVDYLENNLPTEDMRLRSLFALNLGSIYAWSGKTKKATRYLQEAIKSALAGNIIYLAFLTVGQLGYLQIEWGQLHQAYETFPQGLRLLQQLPIVGWIHLGMATILYEWGDLDAALDQLTAGMELSRFRENSGVLIEDYLLLARIKQAQGDGDGAVAALQEGLAVAQQHSAPVWTQRVRAAQAVLAVAQDRLPEAVLWAAQVGEQTDVTALHDEVAEALVTVLVAQGESGAARRLMEPLLATAASRGKVWNHIRLLARQALALQRQQQTDEALKALAQALALARSGDFVYSFVELGRPLPTLLSLLATRTRRRVQKAYIQKLLHTFKQAGYEEIPTYTLTRREIEVLRLLAGGLTNQEIAQELVVATGTVKKHLDNIYNKLEVHSRTQALAKAKEYALL